jgi:hypothetical protein
MFGVIFVSNRRDCSKRLDAICVFDWLMFCIVAGRTLRENADVIAQM